MKHISTFVLLLIFCLNTMNGETLSNEIKPLNHFNWGVDFGSSIDMSGNDMSSIDIEAHFGYKNKTIQALGAGAGIHTALGNDFTCIPVFLMLRTNFMQKPSLCFLDVKVGYSFNSLEQDYKQTNPFGSLGVGFNLSSSSKFRSHITLAYSFFQLKSYTLEDKTYVFNNLSIISVGIGIDF